MNTKFKLCKKVETNEERAKATGLKPAPTLKGYFYPWKDCIENLEENIIRGKKGDAPKFKLLFLETKNACNFGCIFCYTNAGNKKGKIRNGFREWKETIKAAKKAGIEWVAIAGCGEPLLDENFWRLGELVRGEGLNLLAFTNGTLVDMKTAKRLKEMCNTVITKFFALDAEAHDKMVGVKGGYAAVREAFANLLETGMKEPDLGIDLVITKKNENEIDNILRICRMLKVIPYFEKLAFIGRGERVNENISLDEKETNRIFERLREIDEKEFGITWAMNPNIPALAHAEVDKRMIAVHLNVYGEIQPGLATGEIMGNMRDADDGVEEIFQNAKAWAGYYRKIRKETELRIKQGENYETIKCKKQGCCACGKEKI